MLVGSLPSMGLFCHLLHVFKFLIFIAISYGAQGLFKFGLNEFFKDVYTAAVGAENLTSLPAKMTLWAAASGSAEIFADVALCPFEMTKVRMQVTLPNADGTSSVPRQLIPAMQHMSKNAAETRFPFGSLVPLWGRQGWCCFCFVMFCLLIFFSSLHYDQICWFLFDL